MSALFTRFLIIFPTCSTSTMFELGEFPRHISFIPKFNVTETGILCVLYAYSRFVAAGEGNGGN